MEYIVAHIVNERAGKHINEVLIACLNELGYEAFEEHFSGVDAYIAKEIFDEAVLEKLQKTLTDFPFKYTWEVLEDKNWNAEWEANFQPVVVAGKVLIRSAFHESDDAYPYEIVINPQMSFGTGHHETTALMLEALLSIEIPGKKVLDVGYGTGILAIFAALQGAEQVTGADIDQWAYENVQSNIKLNHVVNFDAKQGTVDAITEKDFDIILANINRNVLLADMAKYEARLAKDGILLLSGFYKKDVPLLLAEAEEIGMRCEKQVIQNEWAVLRMSKK